MSEEEFRVEGDLLQQLWRLESLKAQRVAIDEEIEVLTRDIERQVPKSARFTDYDGVEYQATVIRGKTVSINLEYLRAHHPHLFEVVTKPVVDKAAFRRLLKQGVIPPQVALEVATVTDNRPSVRFTPLSELTNDEEDDNDE